jgi:XTP/dITP diphosphohydrolase
VAALVVPERGEEYTVTGKREGIILTEPRGNNGFGYDPVFFYPELKKTFAEISEEEKSEISHRGRALKEVKQEFDKVLTWLDQNLPKQEKFECSS